MIFDFKNKRFAVGPYVRVGDRVYCRLWLWNYLRVGSKRKIVRHS